MDQNGHLAPFIQRMEASAEHDAIVPDDGVLDGAGESFSVRLGPLARGQHIITIHVVDEADNHGAGEATAPKRIASKSDRSLRSR